VPEELGQLVDLQQLFLNDNQLSGELPASLARLKDATISIDNNQGLCAPAIFKSALWYNEKIACK
jgi:hypothetical protein